jgi:hypothetical protein
LDLHKIQTGFAFCYHSIAIGRHRDLSGWTEAAATSSVRSMIAVGYRADSVEQALVASSNDHYAAYAHHFTVLNLLAPITANYDGIT